MLIYNNRKPLKILSGIYKISAILKNNEILYEAEEEVKNIVFEDPYVNTILLDLYDTNKQGYLLSSDISSIIITNTVFSGNTDIVSFNELIYFGNTEIAAGCFQGCTSLQSINLQKITRIGANAFESCNITHLYLNNIQNIGNYAFKDNKNLKFVVIDTKAVPTCGINPFIGCTNLYAIYVPDKLYDSFLAADNWQNYLNCIYPLSRKLPDDYTLGTYIASTKTGGQYIDLQYPMWNESPLSYTIDIQAEITGSGLDNDAMPTLLNAMKEISPYPGLVLRTDGSQITIIRTSGSTTHHGNTADGVVHITKSEDNISVSTHTVNTTLFAGYDGNNNPWRYIEAKIFFCKLKTNSDTWERDLIPCKDANNIPGLYDLANKAFYKSLSAEPFVYFLNKYVYFEDMVAANKCKELFGEYLTIEALNAIKITDIKDKLSFSNSQLKKFNEFKYFTKLEKQDNSNFINLIKMFANSTLEEVTIPASSNGYTYGWYDNYIDNSPFTNCSNLIKVNLNGALFSQDYCFAMYNQCTSLPFSVDLIPANFTILPGYFFNNCKAMTHIIIPEGITTVNMGMIQGATNVEYVIFPTTLTSWNMYDFNRDGRTNDIYLKRSSSITSITNTDGDIGYFKDMNIYVADNLLADYQADTNWAALLSKYPNNITLYSDNNLPAKLQEYKEVNN